MGTVGATNLPTSRIRYPFWIIGDLNTRWGRDTGDSLRDNSRIAPILSPLQLHGITPLNIAESTNLPGSTNSGTFSFPDVILTNSQGRRFTVDPNIDNPEWAHLMGSDHHLIGLIIGRPPRNYGTTPSRTDRRIWSPDIQRLKMVFRHHHSSGEPDNCQLCVCFPVVKSFFIFVVMSSIIALRSFFKTGNNIF